MCKCEWCGEEFEKKSPNEKYCSPECRKYGYQDKTRIRQQKYRKRWKDVLNEEQKYHLGSWGARLGAHMNDDFEKEMKLVECELKILKLR